MMFFKPQFPYPFTSEGKFWQNPLSLSMGFHVLMLIIAFLMPTFFDRKPSLPEFYTVNLFTVAEIPESTPVAQQEIAVEKDIPAAVSVTKQPEAAATSAPVQVISIKPVKHKIKHADTQKEVAIEKNRQALLAERKRAERVLEQSRENASTAAREAIDMLRKSIQTSAVVDQAARNAGAASQTTTPAAVGPVGTGIAVDEMMKQYYAAVYQRIQAHWFLPPLQDWDDSLEAILVIKVRRDGKITKTFFEKKSTNLYFNQFLNKTVRDSEPLPSFSKEINQSSLEIGLRFTPAGVH